MRREHASECHKTNLHRMQALRIDFIFEACANTEQNYVSDTQGFTQYGFIQRYRYINIDIDIQREHESERNGEEEGQRNLFKQLFECYVQKSDAKKITTIMRMKIWLIGQNSSVFLVFFLLSKFLLELDQRKG